MPIPQDSRDPFWAGMERDIQKRGSQKDSHFKLSGRWKRFVRKQEGFKVCAVDGVWIRNNLSIIFGHGGHGLVHEFIPHDEIWISTEHYHESKWNVCGCTIPRGRKKVSRNYFDSTVIHEITEYYEMKKGKSYWKAHNLALQKEIKIGLLPDPYTDTVK